MYIKTLLQTASGRALSRESMAWRWCFILPQLSSNCCRVFCLALCVCATQSSEVILSDAAIPQGRPAIEKTLAPGRGVGRRECAIQSLLWATVTFAAFAAAFWDVPRTLVAQPDNLAAR